MRKTYKNRSYVMYRMVAVILTLGIILLGVLIGSSISASGRSSASDEKNTFKYYTSIEIENGDSLWTLAEEHITVEYDSIQDYIDEIMEVNQLNSHEIHAGQYLMIPYYSSEFH